MTLDHRIVRPGQRVVELTYPDGRRVAISVDAIATVSDVSTLALSVPAKSSRTRVEMRDGSTHYVREPYFDLAAVLFFHHGDHGPSHGGDP